LRLLYECNPLAFIIEQAGGKATDGKMRIMEKNMKELHQRTPLFIGSTEMVEKAMEFISTYETATS
jgi:fructose-1,6-bisphosphatase I